MRIRRRASSHIRSRRRSTVRYTGMMRTWRHKAHGRAAKDKHHNTAYQTNRMPAPSAWTHVALSLRHRAYAHSDRCNGPQMTPRSMTHVWCHRFRRVATASSQNQSCPGTNAKRSVRMHGCSVVSHKNSTSMDQNALQALQPSTHAGLAVPWRPARSR